MRIKSGLMLAVFVVVLPFSAFAGSQSEHLLDKGSISQGPVALSEMNQRILDAAKEYDAYAPVPRVALFDTAYPRDAKEYAALKGYGVFLVTILTQKKDEIPPKRVYVKTDHGVIQLELFTSVFEKQPGSAEVRKVFGPYRWDGLYYFPVYLVSSGNKVAIDFGENRNGFIVAEFGNQDRSVLDFLGKTIVPPKVDRPPSDALIKLVKREYPGFLTNK